MKSKVLEKILKDKDFSYEFEDDELLCDYTDHLESIELSPKSKNKKNHVGIEIECFSHFDGLEVTELILENDLESWFQSGEDCSIEEDFGNPYEFRGLFPEKELSKRLKALSKFFKKDKFGVNESCGLHIHLDMRNRNVENCYKKLLKMQDILFGMVDSDRWHNDFCNYTPENIAFNNRYMAINKESYHKHKTIEIRLHHATLDMKLIEKWITLLLKIINSAPAKKIESKADVLKWVKGKKSIKRYVAKNFNEKWFTEKVKKVSGDNDWSDDYDEEYF